MSLTTLRRPAGLFLALLLGAFFFPLHAPSAAQAGSAASPEPIEVKVVLRFFEPPSAYADNAAPAKPQDVKVLLRPKAGLATPSTGLESAEGMAVDILRALAPKCGLKLAWQILPQGADLHASLSSGQGNLVADWGVSEERARQFAFTSPYMTMSVNLFVRQGSDAVKDPAYLSGLRIGVVERNISDEILSPRKDVTVVRYPSLHEALFHLLAGEIDALSHLGPVLLKEAENAGLDDRIRMILPAIVESPRAFAARKEDAALVARLDPVLKDFVGTPEYGRIYRKYFGVQKPYWTAQRILAVNASVVVVLLAAAAVWHYSTLRRLNRELAESRGKYRDLVETTTDMVWELDADGVLTYISPACRPGLGYDPGELIGRRDLPQFTSPSGQDQWKRICREAAAGRKPIVDAETVLFHKSGRRVVFEVCAAPVYGPDGAFRGFRGISRNATQRKQLEEDLQRSEQDRLMAQKYEAIGKLAGGIAHNLNNLMTIVSGYGSLILKGLDDVDPRRRNLEAILNAVERASSLTGKLLAFSRQAILMPEVQPVDGLIESLVPSLREILGPEIELVVRKEAGGAAVRVDGKQFRSVVEELARNAKDAMPSGGHLYVASGVESIDDSDAKKVWFVPPGRYVTVTVTDTGCGMDQEALSRLYEPFYTTKGLGRGMGLPGVYGFVKQCRGYVYVDSFPEKGTMVKIFLPLTEVKVPV